MQKFILSIVAVPHLYWFGKTLIRSTEPDLLQHVAYYFSLGCIRKVGRFIHQRAASILVTSDRGEMPVRIIERGDYLRSFRHEEFLPHRALVLFAYAIQVRFQRLGFRQICELLVMKSSNIT